jgi:hypothetical protein
VKTCPVAAYTDEEYTAAWSASLAVEAVGFCLNVFMMITWQLYDVSEKVAIELKMCVWAGLLYGVVHTLPVLLLKVYIVYTYMYMNCFGSC